MDPRVIDADLEDLVRSRIEALGLTGTDATHLEAVRHEIDAELRSELYWVR